MNMYQVASFWMHALEHISRVLINYCRSFTRYKKASFQWILRISIYKSALNDTI